MEQMVGLLMGMNLSHRIRRMSYLCEIWPHDLCPQIKMKIVVDLILQVTSIIVVLFLIMQTLWLETILISRISHRKICGIFQILATFVLFVASFILGSICKLISHKIFLRVYVGVSQLYAYLHVWLKFILLYSSLGINTCVFDCIIFTYNYLCLVIWLKWTLFDHTVE